MKRVLFWVILFFCANFTFAQKNQMPMKLKVCSYNIGHFNQGSLGGFQLNKNVAEAELKRWKQWIGKEGFDILSVNEWNSYFDKDSIYNAQQHLLDPFYSTVVMGESKRWIFNGLASNYKLTNIRQKNWDGDYYAIIGDMHVGDEIITVISTHIPWQKDWHDNSLNMLIQELKKYKYFICLGDMNASDKNQLKFTSQGFNMANGGHLGWFNTCGGKALKSGYQGAIDYNIDNIITSSNIKIFNVSAPMTGLNDLDHLPIIADLVISWN
ncbi:endonuclease/exonuclease/phosphatase family protein [Sphingobacterium bovisgrunnientis]|jgi:endonuclease/exonuclease/phosphatase family metal-dependent hydrolase|uniref:endonuclease/exonuclease/phosphatase family protein n=1 Tax=Sphingobacterium bovisgrunnientis TaxID=1874697 RepID=UPI00135C037D|nr:endonuclease/exonuclease/phosphatase family protein [Sphingobacterium bovisgrunnientis]